MTHALKPIAIALTLIAIVIFASNEDYKEEQRELERYCRMVAEGHWPDMRNIYDTECN